MESQNNYIEYYINDNIKILEEINPITKSIGVDENEFPEINSKLIRQINKSNIIFNVVDCFENKKTKICGYFYTGSVYLTEYVNENTVNYYNITAFTNCTNILVKKFTPEQFLNLVLQEKIGEVNLKNYFKIFLI